MLGYLQFLLEALVSTGTEIVPLRWGGKREEGEKGRSERGREGGGRGREGVWKFDAHLFTYLVFWGEDSPWRHLCTMPQLLFCSRLPLQDCLYNSF